MCSAQYGGGGKPKGLCKTCHSKASPKDSLKRRKTIQCFACHDWYHMHCQTLDSAPDSLMVFRKYDKFVWYCKSCVEEHEAHGKRLQEMEAKERETLQELEARKRGLDETTAKLRYIEERVEKLKDASTIEKLTAIGEEDITGTLDKMGRFLKGEVSSLNADCDNLGECRICFQYYTKNGSRKPKTLSCSHTFCTLCLLKTMTEGILLCPKCQAIHEIHSETSDSSSTDEKDGPISKRERDLERIRERIVREMMESERNFQEFVERDKVVMAQLQEARKGSKKNFLFKGNDFLYVLMTQEKIFGQLSHEAIENAQRKATAALRNLEAAETREEVQLYMMEVKHYEENFTKWKDLVIERCPRLETLLEIACTIKRQGLEDASEDQD